MKRRLLARNTQEGGGEVDEADPAVTAASYLVVGRSQVFPFLGDMHYERDVETPEKGPPFTSRHP